MANPSLKIEDIDTAIGVLNTLREMYPDKPEYLPVLTTLHTITRNARDISDEQ
jgi:hypothetical protein